MENEEKMVPESTEPKEEAAEVNKDEPVTIKESSDKEPGDKVPSDKEPAEATGAEPEVVDIVIEDEDIAPPPVYYDEKAFKKHGRKGKAFKIILITLAVLILIGYGVMTALAYRYFQMNTFINGVDYSFKTPAYAQSEIDDQVAGYFIHLTLRNGSLTISPSDIGLKITTEKDIKKIKDEQNPFLWFMAFFKEDYNASYSITYDKDRLRSYIERQPSFMKSSMTAPTNPTIIMQDGEPVIVPGTVGTTIDVERVISLIEEMIPKMESELDLEAKGCYIAPEYTERSERVVDCRNKIASYTNLMLIYQIADVNIQIKSDEIYNMLTVDLDDYYCVVSRKKVEKYVADFAAKHDTLGTERLFRTHDNKMVRLTSDRIGWQVDQEAELDHLYKDISRRNSFIREPEFSSRAYSYTVNGSDIGNTYVEVDLSNQKAYFYKDRQLVISGDIISGRPSRGADTPGGFYTLYGGYMNVVLRGPDYASPVVYWMPFNGGIGLHDASWQSKFGGDLFLTRGSHGCVNLEFEMARTVYQHCYKGMSVVCYWRNSTYMVDPKDATDTRIQQSYNL